MKADRLSKHRRDQLQENLPVLLGAVRRKGEQGKRFVYDVVARDCRDWVTAMKKVGEWYLRGEGGGGEFEDAW